MAQKGEDLSVGGGDGPEIEVFASDKAPQKTGHEEIQEFDVERVEKVYRCSCPRPLSRMSYLHG